MDIEIIKEKENQLLDRKEISFTISHMDATPSRDKVKNTLVAQLNSQYELVIIDKLTTEYGTQRTIGYAKVYSDARRANQIENKHILERNKPKPAKEAEEPAKDESEEEEVVTEEPVKDEAVEEVPPQEPAKDEPMEEEIAPQEAATEETAEIESAEEPAKNEPMEEEVPPQEAATEETAETELTPEERVAEEETTKD